MTLDELNKHISALLKSRREVKIPTAEGSEVVKLNEVIPLISQNMLMIANRYKVLKLVTPIKDFKLLRVLGDGTMLRRPDDPVNLTDVIDMDSELCIAVANYVAADLAVNQYNRNIFKKAARKIVKDYAFKIYNTPAIDKE